MRSDFTKQNKPVDHEKKPQSRRERIEDNDINMDCVVFQPHKSSPKALQTVLLISS